MDAMDMSDDIKVFYDWNDVDDTAVISKGDVIFAGSSDGGMKVRVTGFSIQGDSVLITFERLSDSVWVECDVHDYRGGIKGGTK